MKSIIYILLLLTTSCYSQDGYFYRCKLKGVYEEKVIYYQSTIDKTITTLYMKICYDKGIKNMPIICIGHGWNGNADDNTQYAMRKFASYGYFVISIGMRGRNGAAGTKDASCRELRDIIDGVEYCLFEYKDKIGYGKIFDGYSGGGGNALALAVKYPDYFNVIIDNFGMSDYGATSTSWAKTDSAAYYSSIITTIGAITNVNNYYARNARAAIRRNQKSYIYIFHDASDVNVSVRQSDSVYKLMDKNYTRYFRTTAKDKNRAIHDNPNLNTGNEWTEKFYKNSLLVCANKSILSKDTFIVLGNLKTKQFEVWLNTGTDAVDTLIYDLNLKRFTFRHITNANHNISVTYKGQTITHTNILNDIIQF